MRPQNVFLLTALTANGGAAASEPSGNTSGCNAVQLFLVRGHGEDMPGKLSTVASAVCGPLVPANRTCGYASVAYNAHSNATTLCADQTAGVELARADLAAYARRCPEARLVVAGWSRGGAIATDLLAGGGGPGVPIAGAACEQPATPALAPTEFPGDRVAAVVTFGEFHHNADKPWNVGNGSAEDGQSPRNEAMLQNLALWQDRFRDFCHRDDPLCAKGNNSAAHSSYFEGTFWLNQVADFVLSKI